MAEHRLRVVDVLDRLQEHDGVELRLGPERLDQPPLERQPGTGIAEPRVLVGVGVGVEPDDGGGPPCEDIGAVPLAAGHVEHAPAGDPFGDPLVHRQVAAKPVVLGGDVGQRPLAGQLERRHPGRLVLLNVGVQWHGRQGNVTPAMEALRSADEIRDVNTRYHDVAAASYDAKWGIDFGEVGQSQVIGKLRKLIGPELDRGYQRSLEIGAGTGYFTLNLLQAGVVRDATCTDISPGMVTTLGSNARRLGLDVRTARADAESLPFADQSFDLVLGHAVLHHLPDLRKAFAEFDRVLAPGGRIAFAGEPSRIGDRIALVPKRGAGFLAPVWRRAIGAGTAQDRHDGAGRSQDDHELERWVDIHAFAPGDLATHARRAGFTNVRVRGEELVANWFGWFNRALEATAAPDDVPMLWRQYAFRGYLLLQQLDERVLEPVLPPAIFYNLLLTARKPNR